MSYEDRVFFVDEGAVYDLLLDHTGQVILATGRGTGIAYTSEDHGLTLTGKLRRQGAAGRFRVDGYRAVLTLDTGEGLLDLAGVVT